MVSSSNRTGRRPGTNETREQVLDAARALFTEKGFDGATIRAIAATAGVDPALVLHYFGSKRGLFTAAAEMPFDPAQSIPAALEGDPGTAGERLLRFFLSIWDSGDSRDGMLALVRAAVTDAQAAEMFRQRFSAEIIARLAGTLPGPDANLRASLVGSTLAGLVFARYIVRLEPLASLSADELAATIGPTLQRYLHDPLDSTRGGTTDATGD